MPYWILDSTVRDAMQNSTVRHRSRASVGDSAAAVSRSAAALRGQIYVPGGTTQQGFGAVATHERLTPSVLP